MYDFHKSRNQNNENEFRHKLFKRDNYAILSEIKRKITENEGYDEINVTNKPQNNDDKIQ